MDIYSQLFSSITEDLHVDHSLQQCIQAPCKLDPVYVAKVALKESLLKKWQPIKPDKALEDKAISLFRFANEKCAGWRPEPNSRLLSTMRDMAFADFSWCSEFDWCDYLDHAGLIPGSGASVQSKGQNTFFEKLFINQHTTTSAALNRELMRYYARTNRHLLLAERQRRILCGRDFVVVDGSRLSTVRKTAVIDRTICTEPIINMLFQRALGEVINTTLKLCTGYDEALQPDRNRQLARLSSIDDSHATIDLSMASDTVSLRLCQEVLPPWIFAAIEDCRSPSTIYRGEVIPLHMVSSMGNGQTFPLETYLFSLLLRAEARNQKVPFRRFSASYRAGSCFATFGDDMICPSRMYHGVLRSLAECGFVVNYDKSYHSGFFRESCGTDWYDGYNVRGVYLKGMSQTAQYFSAFNRLARWCLIHDVYLIKTLSVCLRKGWQKFVVPPHLSDESGIKLPVSLAPRPRKYNWQYKYLRPVKRFFDCFLESASYPDTDLLVETHRNPIGYLIAQLPQKCQQPALLSHLYPRVVSDCRKLARRDDDATKRYQVSRASTVCWGETIPGLYDPRTLYSARNCRVGLFFAGIFSVLE